MNSKQLHVWTTNPQIEPKSNLIPSPKIVLSQIFPSLKTHGNLSLSLSLSLSISEFIYLFIIFLFLIFCCNLIWVLWGLQWTHSYFWIQKWISEVALKQVNPNPSFCLLLILIFNFGFWMIVVEDEDYINFDFVEDWKSKYFKTIILCLKHYVFTWTRNIMWRRKTIKKTILSYTICLNLNCLQSFTVLHIEPFTIVVTDSLIITK